MDPLSLSILEGMDQVEVVIDSDEENNVNSDEEDKSSDEVEEQDDDADVTYVPEDFGETNSSDGVEIVQDEAESSGTEEVPPKKLKISNVISLSSNSKSPAKNSLPSLEASHSISAGIASNGTSKKGPVRFKANIKHLISNKVSEIISTGSTNNPPCASILKNVLTNENQSTPVANRGLQQNAIISPKATSTPVVTPLVVPGSSSVPNNVNQAAVKLNTSSDLQTMVLVPNQQDFVLEEDTTRINPCFVPGCKIYKNEQMYAFGVPKNEATRQLWNICINNKEHRLDFSHVICYKHFAQEDVIHNFKVVNQNGKDVALDEPRLKKGALPCVKFSDTCCVPNCNKTTGRMYTFPVMNRANLHLWLYLIKNIELKKLSLKDLMRYRVCEVHFESDSFDKDGELEHSAAPTLFLPVSNLPLLPQKGLPLLPQKGLPLLPQKGLPLLPQKGLEPRKENPVKTCAFKKCANQGNPAKLMFSFPNTFNRILGWLGACNRADLIGMTLTETLPKLANVAVCEDHFQSSDFENSMMNKLKDSAVPSARIPRVTEDVSETQSKSIKLTPILLESCIYRGCKNKPTTDEPFFFFPADMDRYKEWMKACGYKCFGKHFYAYKICPNHFSKNMFDKRGYLLETAIPFKHPDPNLIVSPVVHPKKILNPELSSQKFQSEGRVETVLNLRDKREVVVIQDTRTLDAPEEEGDGDLICAVRNCMSLYKFSEGEHHRFPNPKRDSERFEIWLKLVANNNLLALSKTEICKSYMVCKKHFEKRFYSKRIPTSREKILSDEAVPTLNLPADSCLLKEWDYYKDRLKKYLDALAAGGPNEEEEEKEDHEPVITSWVTTESVRLSDLEDKTRCVLEKDRLSFPGMGCNLMISTNDKKAKFPYNIYRAGPAGYGLTNDIEIGENVHIHTAIIIDDDDECERQVLQQLLDRRKRKKYSTES